jgi:RNA polymerase sigma factor (sigma-70 family)
MIHLDADPTFVYETDLETPESEAFTHEQVAEIEEVYRMSYPKLLIRAKSFRKIRDPEVTTSLAFEKAIKKWNTYRDIGYSRETWISGILHNTAISETRKVDRGLKEDTSLEVAEYEKFFDPNISTDIDGLLDEIQLADLMKRFKDLLKHQKKPERWYEIIDLRLRGHTNAEIAERLGIPLGTVASSISRIGDVVAADADFCTLLGKTN